MSKCKRNIILIFGYLLIIGVFLIPYIKEIYVSDIKYASAQLKTSAQLKKEHTTGIIKREIPTFGCIYRRPLNQKGIIILPLYIRNLINHKSFIKWGRQLQNDFRLAKKDKKTLTLEQLLEYEVDIEFNKKYKGSFQIYVLDLHFFLTELVIIILFGGFAYILFCVVLRKSEKRGEK